ncbi:hypothetical protein C0Q70_20583 [Pomacea canaliculata]|uniref:Uncharacterized protein n=2 Tax=Pomacea canaliculata TaxID=400727 RepID=A0A2T7NFY7_POMCA|nr:hypothetical protein C0Q70_20583 [Pomacea canaliculata]
MSVGGWLHACDRTTRVVVLTVGTAAVFAYVVFRLRRFGRCTSQTDLTGKTVVVTGANSGMGYCTALDMARRNARVILASPYMQLAEKAKAKIIEATGNQNVVVRFLDLGSMASVRQFVQEIKQESRLDILVNNAGVINLEQKITEDGLEINMAVNYFGHFLLTVELLDLLKKSTPSRIVNISSIAHKNSRMKTADMEYLLNDTSVSPFRKYATTKLAIVLFTRELARRLDGSGVTAYAVDPGYVATNIGKTLPMITKLLFLPFALVTKSAEVGAQTAIYCAVSDEVKGQSGKYYAECRLAEDSVHPLANDLEATRKLWELSEKWTKPTLSC